MKASATTRTAVFLVVLVCGAFVFILIAALPFLDSSALPILFAAVGAWSAVELALHGRRWPLLVRAVGILELLGLTLFVWGLWQSHVDCRTYNHDGLCFLIGAFMCMVAVAVMLLGALVLGLRSLVIRFRPRAPRVETLVLLLAVMTASGACGCASTVSRIDTHRIGRDTAGEDESARLYRKTRDLYPYYGGTRFDAGCIAYAGGQISEPSRPERADARATESMLRQRDADAVTVFAPGLVFCLLDLPLSALTDTLLLPLDYWAHRTHSAPDA